MDKYSAVLLGLDYTVTRIEIVYPSELLRLPRQPGLPDYSVAIAPVQPPQEREFKLKYKRLGTLVYIEVAPSADDLVDYWLRMG